MTRKFSAMGTITGANVDSTADYIPLIDASVADASKNKTILIDELKTALGIKSRPPTTALFSFTANGTSATQSTTYNASTGMSITKTDSGAAAERVCVRGKAVPASSPWTASAKIRFGAQFSSGSQITLGGMTLHASGTGKTIAFGLQALNGVMKLVTIYYSGLNTFDSDILARQLVPMAYMPTWFQIVESATLYTFNFSLDEGITWVTHTTALKASYFTADKIGAVLHSATAVTILPTILIQHYEDPDFP